MSPCPVCRKTGGHTVSCRRRSVRITGSYPAVEYAPGVDYPVPVEPADGRCSPADSGSTTTDSGSTSGDCGGAF